jgi:hypothetical protein
VGVGVGSLLCVAAAKAQDKQKLAKALKEATTPVILSEVKTPEVDLGIGTAEVMWEDEKNVCVWVNDLTLDDVGSLGEKIREKYPAISEQSSGIQVEVNVY